MDSRLNFVALLSMTLLAGAAGIYPRLAQAEQQAPSQHSPANVEYQEFKTSDYETKAQRIEKITSSVKLAWDSMPRANRYLLKISRAPDMSAIFYTIETAQTSSATPELHPGAYYYIVESYQGDRRIGQTSTKGFVVGQPLNLSGKKERLPAPIVIGPKHRDLYPTYGYVRLAWQRVDGARGYRFRIWNEDKVRENYRWKKDSAPRWVTEVKNPWLEVHDAPYSSYMYLESGLYRWDVTAVDPDGSTLGETSTAYFEVSRQWFLKPSEVFIRAIYGFAPQERYSQELSGNGESTSYTSPSHHLDADLQWYFARQWGTEVGVGLQTLRMQSSLLGSGPTEQVLFMNAHADMLFRAFLSTEPYGWWLVLSAGFGAQEFPQVNSVSAADQTLQISRPKVLGPRFGFEIHKRFNTPAQRPFELYFKLNSLINVFAIDASENGSNAGTPLNAGMQLNWLWHATNHFALSLGIAADSRRATYATSPMESSLKVGFQGISVTLGFQLNYYSPPDNTSYYPSNRNSAYYPSEPPTTTRHDAKDRPIDAHKPDSASWQRWRPH